MSSLPVAASWDMEAAAAGTGLEEKGNGTAPAAVNMALVVPPPVSNEDGLFGRRAAADLPSNCSNEESVPVEIPPVRSCSAALPIVLLLAPIVVEVSWPNNACCCAVSEEESAKFPTPNPAAFPAPMVPELDDKMCCIEGSVVLDVFA